MPAEEVTAPTSKRAKRRFYRKWNDFRDRAITSEWHAQLDAENVFKKAQGAVATIQPADQNELTLMAAAAFYDKTQLVGGPRALISYQVALSYFRLHVMA